MKLNWKYSIAWIIWILGFGIIEYKALQNKKEGDTLSEHIWWAMDTKGEGPSWINWAVRGVLAGGFLWVIPHFFTKWNF